MKISLHVTYVASIELCLQHTSKACQFNLIALLKFASNIQSFTIAFVCRLLARDITREHISIEFSQNQHQQAYPYIDFFFVSFYSILACEIYIFSHNVINLLDYLWMLLIDINQINKKMINTTYYLLYDQIFDY